MNDPHPVDVHVGHRVRIARMAKGISQSALGEAVGVTFQQVQKYEKGTNRISASRLVEIATYLGLEVPFFFKGASAERDSAKGPPSLFDLDLHEVDFAIVQSLVCIRDAKVKRAIAVLIADLAGARETTLPPPH